MMWWRIKNIVYSLTNLVAWFKIIWNDRDWDWTWTLKLLEHKLRRKAKHFRKHGHHMLKDHDAANMEKAADLCKRMRDWDYDEHPLAKAHYDKWGIGIINYKKGLWEPSERKLANPEQCREEYLKMNAAVMAEKEALWDDLFKLLRSELGNWWD